MGRLRLTLRGVVLIIVGVVVLAAAYVFVQPYALVPGVFALAVVAAGWVWALTRRVAPSLDIRPPAMAEEGSAFELTLSAPAAGLDGAAVVLDVAWGIGHTPPWRLTRHGEFVREAMRIRGLRRGVWHVGPGTATLSDPFGVCTVSFTLTGQALIVVAPRPAALQTAVLGIVEQDTGSSGRGDFVDALVREYRSGDPARRIHWRQSARRDALMVRAEESPDRPSLVVLLDTDADSYPDLNDRGRSEQFDEAARVATKLLLDAHDNGVDGWLLESSPPRLVLRGTRSHHEVQAALAESTPHENDAEQEPEVLSELLSERHPIVVTSSDADPSVLKALVRPGSHVIVVGDRLPEALPTGLAGVTLHPLERDEPEAT